MGNYFDAMFSKFEQQANNSGMLAGMTKAERADFYGRMAVRIQNQELAQGLSGTQNLPAVIQGNLIPSIPAQAGDVVETATKNEGFKVVKKWASKFFHLCTKSINVIDQSRIRIYRQTWNYIIGVNRKHSIMYLESNYWKLILSLQFI